MHDTPTPSQVAQNEAAKQAVVLVFAVATVLIFIPLQRRMLDHLAKLQADPSSAELEKMRQAQKAEGRWNRLADYLFQVRIYEGARLAWARARKARAEYEAGRA